MPIIDFGDDGRIEVPAGSSVLRASLTAGLRHARACGGRGRCTTCRVLVETGLEHCPPPNELETEALSAHGLEGRTRLACQLRPEGDVRVRILIREGKGRAARDAVPAVEEHVAVLFVDLRGFTRFAETHLPFDVGSVLNRYFDIMGGLVERHDGRILDYLGDGLMVLFRPAAVAPAERAVACALGMRRAGKRFAAYVAEHFGAELSVGMAIHSGRAVVGDMGYFRERHLNAVGDVLNVVARLEEHNKSCGTDLLASESVANDCGGAYSFGGPFDLVLRGRAATVRAFPVDA